MNEQPYTTPLDRIRDALGDEAGCGPGQAQDPGPPVSLVGMTAAELDALDGPLDGGLDGGLEDPAGPATGPGQGRLMERIAEALERIAAALESRV